MGNLVGNIMQNIKIFLLKMQVPTTTQFSAKLKILFHPLLDVDVIPVVVGSEYNPGDIPDRAAVVDQSPARHAVQNSWQLFLYAGGARPY